MAHLAISRLWHASPELIATAALMLAALAAAGVGLIVDPTVITGAPAWLKPAKFAVSIAIYCVTLAWIFTFLTGWPRTRRVVGWLTAITLIVEMVIIAAQAWRGTSSHFNVGTPLDAVLFAIMGLAIFAQTAFSVAVVVALWRQPFVDPSLGWALRLGMTLSVVGASTGALMTQPTTVQIEAARAGQRMTVSGAHTVGAADGGPGVAGTGWSVEHGDLRVPHFVGLHAMQALPLLVLGLARLRIRPERRVRVVSVAAGSYALLYVVLLVQALRGIPVVAPDAATLTHFAAWVVVSGAAAGLALRGADASRQNAIN